ncbi:BnaC04g12530D [Brassica napus]|uniref:BnaC04g12530D protein n=2 Tax=Brassica TaxID=3705 RepID=A0A078FJC8_BRANA|nr:BnaC04g12530D [Brassica napus]
MALRSGSGEMVEEEEELMAVEVDLVRWLRRRRSLWRRWRS